MVWRILFYIGVIFYVMLGGLSYLYPDTVVENTEISFLFGGIIVSIVYVIILGYFGCLGWNKKIFSLKFTNIIIFILSIFSLGFILLLIAAFLQGFLTGSPYAIVSFIGILTGLVIAVGLIGTIMAIITLPVYMALFKYKKRLEKLENIDNGGWKLFSLFIVLSYVSSLIFLPVFCYKNIMTQYNFWDMLFLLSCIYEILFIIGFAFNKKIFNQLFWKISTFIYVPLVILSSFLSSKQFKNDIFYTSLQHLWTYKIFLSILTVLFLYILYNYAFTNKVYEELKKN